MRVPPLARRASPLATVAVVLLALSVPAPVRAAPDSGTVLSWLSGQRERNGIPGALAERIDWSAGCAAHMSYVAQNGGILTHQEVPGMPGYSDAGNWAGTNSVLSTGTWTTADHDPFENAPIHLAQMLAPALTASGVSNVPGLCITTWPGYDRPAPAATTIYTYPGPGTTIYPVQNVRESPFTPQAKLGLSENGNGPTIYAFGMAAGGGYFGQPKLVSASLSGPTGAVPVVAADWTNPDFGPGLPPGTALVIPTSPLQTGATYTAQVTMRAAGDAQDVTRTWSFVTGAVPQALPGGALPPEPAAAQPPPPAAPITTPVPTDPAIGPPAPEADAAQPRVAGSIRRLGPRRVRARLRLPSASVGRALRVAAVLAGGRVAHVTTRRVHSVTAILRLRVPRGTVALLIRVPAGPGTGPTVVARARLRVPAA